MAGQLTITEQMKVQLKTLSLLNMLPEFIGHCRCIATCHICCISEPVIYCTERRKWIKESFKVQVLCFSGYSEN